MGFIMKAEKDKIRRVLSLYAKLTAGGILNKAEEAAAFGVTERSIQRDLEDIRQYLGGEAGASGVLNTVVYDRNRKGYRLERLYDQKLRGGEILAVCKILLDSRAFRKKDMTSLLARLIACCASQAAQEEVKELIQNEEYHYIEPRHRADFIDKLWELGRAVREHCYVQLSYRRLKDRALVERRLQPVALMFSEYYFYLTAFIEDEEVRAGFDVADDAFPTIYRVDRIEEYRVLEERFHVPYANRFEEGEFRKRIQFMYGGKLRRVRFTYAGSSVEAVLDRLPTAKIEKEEEGVYTISAEVFGKGIEMWLRSQGDLVRVLELR